MLRTIFVIARHNLRLLLKDPAPLVINLLMPLVFMAFLRPTYQLALAGAGYTHTNGAEQAVPGLAVMFSLFWISYAAIAFYREHGWGTWERLRASPASPAAILIGKVLPCFVFIVVQFALVFAAGALLFGLHVQGFWVAMALVGIALSVFLVSAAVMLVALCNSMDQMQVLANMSALVFAGLGGCLTPIDALPHWMQRVAALTPSYWAMQGFRATIFHRSDLGAVFLSVLVLLGMAGGCIVVSALRFRLNAQKQAST